MLLVVAAEAIMHSFAARSVSCRPIQVELALQKAAEQLAELKAQLEEQRRAGCAPESSTGKRPGPDAAEEPSPPAKRQALGEHDMLFLQQEGIGRGRSPGPDEQCTRQWHGELIDYLAVHSWLAG